MLRHTIDQMDAWSRAQLAIQSKANNPCFYTPYGQVRYSDINDNDYCCVSDWKTDTDNITLREALKKTYNVYYNMEDKTEMNKHETKIDQHGFEKIIQNGSAVIVFWTDKTKTVVKLKEDDRNDIYAAVAQALAKKIYKNNSSFHKKIDKVLQIQD